MSTDLFGVPLGEAPVFELSPHQKRQATLLYHWTSEEYLKGLLVLIDDVMKGADNCLSLAHTQRRDELIANPQWGVRDTAGNWASLAWPALEDFKQSTIRLMGWRLQDMYCGTDLTQCDRMLSEISPYWMTPEEKTWFDSRWGIIDAYASRLDQAVGTGSHRPMDDLEMTLQWEEFGDQIRKLPMFRVHTNRVFASGELPHKTGVYVPVDDPNGTLQFAWTGSNEGALGDCSTLSAAGLEILRKVGRQRMWIDREAMVATVVPMYKQGRLRQRGGFSPGDESDADCVNHVIAEDVFTARPCKWFYVEKIEGEYEETQHNPADDSPKAIQGRLRCEARQPCPRTGMWFTPSMPEAKHFKQGEVMPEVNSDYGQTIWYLDRVQD